MVILAAAPSLALGIGLPATATQQQVCGNNGSGYCLNDWNGNQSANAAVKMYYGNSSNENFYEQAVKRCYNGSFGYVDTVLSTQDNDYQNCPFTNINLDYEFAGDQIVQIAYGSGQYCVASGSNNQAVLGTCANPSNGSGPANGVIMIVTNNCGTDGNGQILMDRYASDQFGKEVNLDSGNAPGNQANFSSQQASCWGGL